MTKENNKKQNRFKVYIKPQSFSDYFIATMDPKDPFKICLYPSVKSQLESFDDDEENHTFIYDEPEQLILNNYLMLKRNCTLNR